MVIINKNSTLFNDKYFNLFTQVIIRTMNRILPVGLYRTLTASKLEVTNRNFVTSKKRVPQYEPKNFFSTPQKQEDTKGAVLLYFYFGVIFASQFGTYFLPSEVENKGRNRI